VLGVCGWLAWEQRARLMALPARPARFGIGVIAAGLLLEMAGVESGVHLLSAMSMPVTLAGLLLAWRGPGALRALSFPLAYFFFAIPLASIEPITSSRVLTPLREFAAASAAAVLNLLGVQTLRTGTVLQCSHFAMQVDCPCSGIGSLVALLAVAALLAHLAGARPARAAALIAAAIPIAISANGARLTLTALLGVTCGEKLASGFLHQASGLFAFAVGTAILLALPAGDPDAAPRRALEAAT
jgi:exosortase